jgi:hypothetical protein
MQVYRENYEPRSHACKRTDKRSEECLYQFKFSDSSALIALELRSNESVESQLFWGFFNASSLELTSFMLAFVHESSNGAIDINKFAKEIFPAAVAKRNIIGGNTEKAKLSGYYVEVTVGEFKDVNTIIIKISDVPAEAKTNIVTDVGKGCKITGLIYDKNKPMALIGNSQRGVNDSVCGGRISRISPVEIIVIFPDNKERKYGIGDIIEWKP